MALAVWCMCHDCEMNRNKSDIIFWSHLTDLSAIFKRWPRWSFKKLKTKLHRNLCIYSNKTHEHDYFNRNASIAFKPILLALAFILKSFLLCIRLKEKNWYKKRRCIVWKQCCSVWLSVNRFNIVFNIEMQMNLIVICT